MTYSSTRSLLQSDPTFVSTTGAFLLGESQPTPANSARNLRTNTLVASTMFGTAQIASDADGASIETLAATDYREFPVTFNRSTTQFSVAIVFKPAALPTVDGRVFWVLMDSGGFTRIGFDRNGGQLRAFFGNNTWAVFPNSWARLTAGQLNTLVVTVSGNVATLYTPGAAPIVGTWTGTTPAINAATRLRFGMGNNAGTGVPGRYYYWQLWGDLALSATDAQRIANDPRALLSQPVGAPAAPTGVVVDAITDTTARIRWADNADNETSYLIEVRTPPGTGTYALEAEVPADSTSAGMEGLTRATNYGARVVAVSALAGQVFRAESPEVTFTTRSATVIVNGTIPLPPPTAVDPPTVTAVEITPPGPLSVANTDTVRLAVVVRGTNSPPQEVDLAIVSGGGTLDVASMLYAAGGPGGQTRIRATSRFDSTKFAEVSIQVAAPVGPPAPTVTQVRVTPAGPIDLPNGGNQVLTASVIGDNNPNPGVTWTKTGVGTLAAVTATTVRVEGGTAEGGLAVTATSIEDPTRSATVQMTVQPAPTQTPQPFILIDDVTRDGQLLTGQPVRVSVMRPGATPAQDSLIGGVAATTTAGGDVRVDLPTTIPVGSMVLATVWTGDAASANADATRQGARRYIVQAG